MQDNQITLPAEQEHLSLQQEQLMLRRLSWLIEVSAKDCFTISAAKDMPVYYTLSLIRDGYRDKIAELLGYDAYIAPMRIKTSLVTLSLPRRNVGHRNPMAQLRKRGLRLMRGILDVPDYSKVNFNVIGNLYGSVRYNNKPFLGNTITAAKHMRNIFILGFYDYRLHYAALITLINVGIAVPVVLVAFCHDAFSKSADIYFSKDKSDIIDIVYMRKIMQRLSRRGLKHGREGIFHIDTYHNSKFVYEGDLQAVDAHRRNSNILTFDALEMKSPNLTRILHRYDDDNSVAMQNMFVYPEKDEVQK